MRWHWRRLSLPVEGKRHPPALAHENCLLTTLLRTAWALSPVTGVTDRRGFTPTELVAFGCNGLLSFRTRHQLCCSHLCTGSLGKCLLPGDLSSHPPWLPMAAVLEVALAKRRHHRQLPAPAAGYAVTLTSSSCQ